jgi:hypothetical protein
MNNSKIVYKNEKQIEEKMGEFYNNTMCHRMKLKDTTSDIFPTNGLWKSDIVYKTSNQVNQPTDYSDKYLDKLHYIKTGTEKKYADELAKANNIDKQRKLNQAEKLNK